MVISSKLSTREGDPLGKTLFVLVHLHAFWFTIPTHSTCVFISLVDDMHIIGFASNVVFVFMSTT